jgi:cytochrome c oxidase assembly protein subunit 15
MIKHLKWLSVLATLVMAFVLLGGALVTKTGSEDGCGDDWPLCEGQLIPSEFTFEMVIELSHRLVSGVAGIIVIVLAILAWRHLGHVREVKFLSISSVFFLILQALMGAAAVMWGQNDFVLAVHFGISLISFATVFLLMLLIFETDKLWDSDTLFIQKKHRIEIIALTIFTLLVVYTGALVRHTNSELACPDWPLCSTGSAFDFASFSFQQWVQMGHRMSAGILFIWTVVFFIKVMKNYKHSKVMTYGWGFATFLLLSQVIVGALLIFTLLSLVMTLAHGIIISVYFGVQTFFILLAYRSYRQEKAA